MSRRAARYAGAHPGDGAGAKAWLLEPNPRPLRFTCLMAVLFASTFAAVAPVTMLTLISFRLQKTVRQSLFVSGWAAISTSSSSRRLAQYGVGAPSAPALGFLGQAPAYFGEQGAAQQAQVDGADPDGGTLATSAGPCGRLPTGR